MNILPFIFTLLLIFSALSLQFIREEKSFFLFESTLKSHLKAERVLRNHLTQRAYRNIKVVRTTKKGNKKAAAASKPRRNLLPPLDNSKLNLSPLLQAGINRKTHPLYEPTIRFIQLLYQKALFKDEPEIAHLLLESFFTSESTGEEIKDFYPKDPKLKSIFYKMLQGTNQYDLATHLGIPPLTAVLTLNPKAPFANLALASPPLLEALLGAQITQTLLFQEKEKSTDKKTYPLHKGRPADCAPKRPH